MAKAVLLDVRSLEVAFSPPRGRTVHALLGVDLSVGAGEFVGLLGESGCGKSTLARTLLRLLPKTAVVSGRAEWEGRDLLSLSEREMAQVRGGRICLIPQDPEQALNPVVKIGEQVAEVLRAHRDWNAKKCREVAEGLLQRVRLEGGERRIYDAYPHQLSGGQKQRVVIAEALACEPALVIADEPTASLDQELEGEIVGLLQELRTERRMALLFITHNPSLLMGVADRVAVMYAGRVVEQGPSQRVFDAPRHPYTQALLKCVRPPAVGLLAGNRLPTISGLAPNAESMPPGCSFAPRCIQRMTACDLRRPDGIVVEEERRVECLLYG